MYEIRMNGGIQKIGYFADKSILVLFLIYACIVKQSGFELVKNLFKCVPRYLLHISYIRYAIVCLISVMVPGFTYMYNCCYN